MQDTMEEIDRLCPHANEAMTTRNETIKGVDYFRFSGRIDHIHLTKDGALCGKPCLSNNYAMYKPHGIICEACLAVANA